jgi:hypothetical protein
MNVSTCSVALLSVLAMAHAGAADDETKAVDCPMHAAHQAGAGHRDGVDRRHDHVTGVGHADSVHHFMMDARGGAIRLEVKDAADVAGRDRIRAHLSAIAKQFAEGRFDLPMKIHDRVPPGVPVMQRLKGSIRYRYEPTDKGGRVVIATGNREALAAVHEFLRFQIDDHRTGDPKEIVTP